MGKKRFGWAHLIVAVLVSFCVFIFGSITVLGRYVGNPAGFLELIRTLHLISSYYVGDMEEKNLYDGAIRGMVEELGDPYSSYLDTSNFEALNAMTEGHFGGVGMVLGMKESKEIIVVSPIEDTPAYKAGIKAGDIILSIDGKDVTGESLNEVVKKLRGKDGTQVTVGLKSADGSTREVTLTRSEIKVKSVYGRMEEGGIGYIRITNFNEETDRDFAATLGKLQGEGMKALVLDLRDNPGDRKSVV